MQIGPLIAAAPEWKTGDLAWTFNSKGTNATSRALFGRDMANSRNGDFRKLAEIVP